MMAGMLSAPEAFLGSSLARSEHTPVSSTAIFGIGERLSFQDQVAFQLGP